MKIKEGFLLREIAGSYVVVPTGGNIVNFSTMLTLNETGAFLWNMLEKDITEEELISGLLAEYDVDEETARSDIADFLDRIQSIGVLDGR